MMTPPRTIEDRFRPIREYILIGSVLDVGRVDSRPGVDNTTDRTERNPNLPHRRICKVAPQTPGVDIDPKGVLAIIPVGRQRLSGLFLGNILKHLKPEGVLNIKSPIPFAGTGVEELN